jgi:L-asparaginase II
MHLDAVREILGGAGLTEADLQTPPDFPLDDVERDSWILAGRDAVPIAMNCSGKHASMLATCVINGWQIKNYRDPSHPLQLEIARGVERCAGEPIRAIGVDGCGAPVLAISLAGLARSVSRLVQGDEQSSGRRVVDAMRAWPQQVGGSRRDVTEFMRAVPGLVAKDGAEGVYVGAFPDGRAFAVKMEDGADRGRTVTVAALLTRMGADPQPLAPLATLPLLGGGAPVGQVASILAG